MKKLNAFFMICSLDTVRINLTVELGCVRANIVDAPAVFIVGASGPFGEAVRIVLNHELAMTL